MICIACDHGGYEMKEHLKGYLQGKGYEVKDLGCDSSAAVDYPLYGQKAGECVATGEAELGIIICGTGLGISIAGQIHLSAGKAEQRRQRAENPAGRRGKTGKPV